MKEKIQKLPIVVVILIALAIMVGLYGILFGVGMLVDASGLFDDTTEYLAQMIAEIGVSAFGLGMMVLFGFQKKITEMGEGWLKGWYIGGFMIGYVMYAFVAQLYLQAMQETHVVQSFVNILIFTVTMFLIGVGEETIFRGAILNLFLERFPKTKGGILAAIILDGVLFGMMHLINVLSGGDVISVLVQACTTIMVGILFSAIYLRSRNLWIVILAHAAMDFAALLNSGVFEGGSLTDGINNIQPLTLVVVPIFLIPIMVLLRPSKLNEIVAHANGLPVEAQENEAHNIAIVSLVLGCVGMVIGCIGYGVGIGLVGILGANISKRMQRENNGLAVGGLITSIAGFAFGVLGVVLMIVIFCNMEAFEAMQNLQI